MITIKLYSNLRKTLLTLVGMHVSFTQSKLLFKLVYKNVPSYFEFS